MEPGAVQEPPAAPPEPGFGQPPAIPPSPAPAGTPPGPLGTPTPPGAVNPANPPGPTGTPQEPQPQGPVPLAQFIAQRQRAAQAENRYRDLEQKHRELSEWADRHKPLIERLSQTPAAPQVPGQPDPSVQLRQWNQLQERLSQMETALDEQRVSMIQSQIESELKVLQKEFPKMRRDEVLVAFSNNPDIPLAELAKASNAEMEGFEAEVIKRYTADKLKPKPPVNVGGGTPAARQPRTFKSIDEATAAAAEHLAHMAE